MLQGNQFEKAFAERGIRAKDKHKHKPRLKKFKCKVCGEDMAQHDGENFMYCTNPECEAKSQYFIFDRK